MVNPRIYGPVRSGEDIEKINRVIRKQARKAKTQAQLSELHKRSSYLVTLTHSPAWKKAFGGRIVSMRKTAKKEYTKTAKAINKRARALQIAKEFDMYWGMAG